MMLRFASTRPHTTSSAGVSQSQIRLTQSKPVATSALPPKADIHPAHWDVRFVPKADIGVAEKLLQSPRMCEVYYPLRSWKREEPWWKAPNTKTMPIFT